MAVGSFSAGLSGLNANGTYLSVIGNNLANINTIGFKSNSVTFQDLVSQTVGGASANPMQVGLGVTTGAISPVFSQGAIENTREATNVAIQGGGFFVVADDDGSYAYTRAGNFRFDKDGKLVTPDGHFVQGYIGIDPATGAVITSGQPGDIIVPPGVLRARAATSTMDNITISPDGTITATFGAGQTVSIGQLALATFNNPKGLVKLRSSRYVESAAAGIPNVGVAGTGGRGTLIGSALEQSNVDIAQEFTQMILAQRGYPANSKTTTVSDELLVDTLNLKR